jgi:hypothetical protein
MFPIESKHTFYVHRLFPENRADLEMVKNMEEPERTDNMAHARRVIKPTCAQAHARACAPTRTQKHVILIAFRGNSAFVNAPEYYVTRT